MFRSLKWIPRSSLDMQTMEYMLITWQVISFVAYIIKLTAQDMTKFGSRDDDGYESILGELRRWVKRLQPTHGIVPILTVRS